MDLGLKERVAVIFAASKGLGKAAALSLAAEGCRVAICSSNARNIEQSAAEIKRLTSADVFPYVVDVGEADQISEFISSVLATWGKIDILINNAGGPPVKTFEETTDQDWEKYYRITVMSVIRAIRAVLPGMKQQRWGRIINITSISVKEPIMNLIYSNALRLAVVGLAKTLSRELGPFGITVHNVAPGYHKTEGLARIVKRRMENGETEAEIYKEWEKSVPLRRIGEPDDLASLITFLASEKAKYMSGNTIQVDGGRYAGSL